MISVITDLLANRRDMFDTFVEIAADAVNLDADQAMAELNRYALRGSKCAVMFDDGTPIGYLIYGPAEHFINWTRPENIVIKMRLFKEGITALWTCCHIHVRRSYLKGGNTAFMAVTYCKDIVAEGGTHLLLWGYATDELCEYAVKKPGGRWVEGLVDHNNRKVGVRDLKVFLDSIVQ